MRLSLRLLINGSTFHVYALVQNGICETTRFFEEAAKRNAGSAESMLALLQRAAMHGPPKNPEKSRDVGNGVFEFKAKALRLCYFFDTGRMIICIHGFQKPSRKVQDREISRAKKVHQDYIAAKAKGPIPITP